MKGTHSDHNEFPEPVGDAKAGNKKNRPLDKEQGDKNPDTSAADAVTVSPFGKVSESEFVELALTGTDAEVRKLTEHLTDEDITKLSENENCSTAMKRVKNLREKGVDAVKKEDIDLLFASAGVELSEDFTAKAFTLFEGAVSGKVEAHRVKTEAALTEAAEKAQIEYQEMIEERLDTYLDLVVEEFMQKNELAISNGIKMDFAEQISNSISTIIESFGIDLPDEKIDVAESLTQELTSKESELNESLETIADLRKTVRAFELKEAFTAVSEGLTDVDREKLSTLAENISYEDVADYKAKVNTLKEGMTASAAAGSTDLDKPTNLTEEKQLTAWQKSILLAARGDI